VNEVSLLKSFHHNHDHHDHDVSLHEEFHLVGTFLAILVGDTLVILEEEDTFMVDAFLVILMVDSILVHPLEVDNLELHAFAFEADLN